MDKQEVLSSQKIWEGMVDGRKTRIVQVAIDDCLVEELIVPAELKEHPPSVILSYVKEDSEGLWCPSDDEKSSGVYMRAFLETRKQLEDVAQFAVSGPPKV